METEQKPQFLNMQKVAEVIKELEGYLNNAIRKGAYDMKEIHDIYECFVVIVEVAKTCNMHQQTLVHIANQQELIKEAEKVEKQQK
jgi:hypothetical protein